LLTLPPTSSRMPAPLVPVIVPALLIVAAARYASTP
jgi:hypothetical protein